LVPPGRLSRAAVGLRGILRRLSDAIAPPPVHVLEGVFGLLDHRVLVALCEMGVPDALGSRTSTAALASVLDVDRERLDRLVRYAAVRGWLRLDRRGRVAPTRVTAFLRNDHPGGWRSWVEFAGGDEVVAAVSVLDPRRDDVDGFAAANGAPFFDWMAEHPSRWGVFDSAMAAGARMHALAILAAADLSMVRSICDVGGGNGELLRTLLDHLPAVQGTVLDLPAVVERAAPHPRLTAVAGDAFESVPADHDLYLLVNVLHDWGDREASAILERIVDAAPGARVLVVDAGRPVVPRDRVATAADVLMAALTEGGRERDQVQLADLGRTAGLELVSSTLLASGDWAHELRVAQSCS
jgi:hypothetical protein